MATDARETKHDTHVEVTVSKVAERRRQGRFQPLRRLFGRRKKREAQIGFSTGKGSNGVVSDDETDQHLRELNPVVPRALSHDSIFTPEELEAGPDQTMSQENVSDKVRNLQRQIAQSIKFGQRPPSLRKSEGDEGSSDEEELPLSPLKVLAQVEAEPAEPEPKQILGSQQVHGAQQAHAVHGAQQAHAVHGAQQAHAVHGAQQAHAVHGAQQAHAVHGAQQAHAVHGAQQAHAVHGAQQAATHSTPVKSPRSKRVLPPNGTIESINLDAVPQSVPRLDNTFAKHKLSVKPKNQRVSRKHRRCTQDLHGVSLPDVLHEDMEAAGVSADDQRHMAAQEERWEMRRKRELEEQSIRLEEMEKTRRAEEKRLRELEEEKCRKLREEEERRIQEEEAEKRRREEEERRIREEEELRHREEEERIRREEIIAREEQERRQLEEETRRHLEEQCKREEEERRKKEEERRQLEEERRCLKEKRLKEEEEERRKRLEEEKQRLKETQRKEEEEQRKRLSSEEAVGSADVQERKRRAEELRWREMEERQRPFSFKVSSGEKQILFQKVNLTPVTPASSQQGGTVADQREGVKASSPEGADSPNLPSSQYVPHTAILVTGAQLCGTAVNLDQIKDTACKSLLGFGEDRKAQGTPPPKSKTSPDRKSDKTKSLNESMLSTDQAGAAVLAEWASIRSKIFKGAEEGKYEDYPDPSRSQTGVGSQDANQPPFSHTNLRKTMSASTKFSITPAKKKFGDSNRNSDLLSPEDKDAEKEAAVLDTSCSSRTVSPAPASKSPNRTNKTARIVDRGSEECMFAKDLPSFLVPGHESRAEGVEMKGGGPGQAEGAESSEEMGQDGEDQPSPFGIKLRRTNFSLRFHSEQSTEKRKKRYSAGDSFDGVPSPLTPLEPDSDASSVFSPTSPLKESGRFSHPSASPSPSPVALRAKPGKSPSPAVHTESEKVLSKTLLYQRPAASLKQAGSVATPPPSPLPKVGRKVSGEYSAQRAGGGGDSSSVEQADTKEETSAVAQLQRSSQAQTPEEEPKEKKSFFPSINIPWRDKVDRKTELIRKDKPSLQSRHSLDSSRVQDKEAGPLWITLALQKQKGFREQQQSREERRSQREARLVERQSKESVALVSHTDGRGSGGPGPCKLPTPEEPRRPDSLLGRFERREHLKKANTLPSSVTVEITDSTPSPPAVKEVSKRFPATDTPQVSTEPAWLALAKRKAKAWSDCPQIIK